MPFLLVFRNWLQAMGIPSNRILGTPLQDVNLLVIWKAAHPTKLPLRLKPGALYGPIRHPHGGLTADLVTRQLTPYEEGIFLLSRYIRHVFLSSQTCWRLFFIGISFPILTLPYVLLFRTILIFLLFIRPLYWTDLFGDFCTIWWNSTNLF